VTNPGYVIDSNPSNYATMSIALGVAASDTLSVTDSTTTYPAGRTAGFLVSNPGALLNLSLLQNVTVRTLLNGTVQESATSSGALQLSALGLFSDTHEGFVSFKSTKPFNGVRVDVGSLVAAASQFYVYGACVSLQ
jgi:hypothetical protein